MIRSNHLRLILVAAVAAAYATSVHGGFVFDDLPWIVDNEAIRALWPPWVTAAGTLRPLLFYSLAVNYAVSGLSPWSYHLVNGAIHAATGLLLFGLLRRGLRLPRVDGALGARGEGLAFATVLLWLVHPLNTQAVTYVIQRGESLASMWLAAALYAFVRGVQAPPRARRWHALVVGCWLAALATKEIAVVLPALILACDILLISGSLAGCLRRHRELYAALAVPVAAALVLAPILRPGTLTGLLTGDAQDVTRWQYAATQAGVLLRYLRLAVWPLGLSLDHELQPVAGIGEAWPALAAVAVLVGGIAWLAWRRRPLALLGLWPLLVLAPTSTVVPLRDLLVEHRMYLPLVAPLFLVVLAAERSLGARRGRLRPALLGISTVVLAALTAQRNADYASELSLWAPAAAETDAGRRYYNLQLEFVLGDGGVLDPPVICVAEVTAAEGSHLPQAASLIAAGDAAGARRVLEAGPVSTSGLNLLGVARWIQGDTRAAEARWRWATTEPAAGAVPFVNLGCALLARGDTTGALDQLREAVARDPGLPEARFDLGTVLAMSGQHAAALTHLEAASAARPGYVEADNNAGAALEGLGRMAEAQQRYRRAAASHWRAALNLGVSLVRGRRYREAAPPLDAALAARPDSWWGLNARGIVRYYLGRLDEAEADLRRLSEAVPGRADVANNLACVRLARGDVSGARRLYEAAVQADGELSAAHHNLGKLLVVAGEPVRAVGHLQRAHELRPADAVLEANLREARARAAR